MSAGRLVREAVRNLVLHKARSGLAILGIVFGVASVICMLSISEVARRDVAGRIERMGLKNVILDSVKPTGLEKREGEEKQTYIARYGTTRSDLEVIGATLPAVRRILPMRVLTQEVSTGAKKSDAAVVATTRDYAKVLEHPVREGRFLCAVDESRSLPVCVLGSEAARTLFPLANPIGGHVRIGAVPFQVVGVLRPKGQTGSGTSFANPDLAVYIPLATSFARFGKLQVKEGEGSFEATELEVSRAVIQVDSEASLGPVASAARHLLESRHKRKDVEVTIPLALMAEHREAQRMFLWVMGSIAMISLLVGGIGIMNIMLANVAERRSEVGLRRALGATRGEILRLFLAESVVLCGIGGALGLAAGTGLAFAAGSLAGWTVAFEPLAFPLGLAVAVGAGVLFGTLPARKAARLDPVLALRSE